MKIVSPLIIILGPTASGKTALGIELAKKSGGAVVSADSRQVYAGLNIGTAKPREAFRNTPHDAVQPDVIDGVPHYLLNVASLTNSYPLNPTPYTLAKWQQDAYVVIDKLVVENQQPILVGGTMLYADSIIFNYSIPAVSPNEKLREELAAQPSEKLYQQLLKKDPAAAKFIEPHHQQRIIRALEVIQATGQPFSATRQHSEPRYPLKIIGLKVAWDTLQKNIEQRARQMLTEGLIEETRKLQEKYYPTLPLLQTMNYKQAAAVLAGAMSEEAAIVEIMQVNMRYAHRQMSWWKRNKKITWFDLKDTQAILKATSS